MLIYIYLFSIYLFVCLFVYLFIYLFIYLLYQILFATNTYRENNFEDTVFKKDIGWFFKISFNFFPYWKYLVFIAADQKYFTIDTFMSS